MLTALRLREILAYNPETGGFTWIDPRGRRMRAGSVAGTVDKANGYRRIAIDGTRYAAHRLAWLYVTGSWPADLIDHQNRCRDDNRFINLRPADNSTNAVNSRERLNATGVRGVDYFADRGLYRARIVKGRRQISLGYFSTAEAASAAYENARLRMFGLYSPAA